MGSNPSFSARKGNPKGSFFRAAKKKSNPSAAISGARSRARTAEAVASRAPRTEMGVAEAPPVAEEASCFRDGGRRADREGGDLNKSAKPECRVFEDFKNLPAIFNMAYV